MIGAIGLGDRLQEEVNETLDLMKKSNKKVLVLSGDKIDTLKSIGVATGLLEDGCQ